MGHRNRNRDTRYLSATAKGDGKRLSEWREGRRIREGGETLVKE